MKAAYLGMERRMVKLKPSNSSRPVFIRFTDLSKEDKVWIGEKRKGSK